MSKTIITTVGTSIFTNYIYHISHDIQEKYERYNSIESDKINEKAHKNDMTYLQTKIEQYLNQRGKSAAAEVQSSLLIQKELEDHIIVNLIASDTVSCVLASRVLSDNKNLNCESITFMFDEKKDIIKGLQVNDRKKFETHGLVNLIQRLNEIINEKYYTNVALNITGGYKASVPYLTLFSQIYNIPLFYIFEDTDELIRIPHAPMSINWGVFERYSNLFQQLDKGIYDWNKIKAQQMIDDDVRMCIWEDDENDLAELNAIGKMYWNIYDTHFQVAIPKMSRYFNENIDKKKILEKSLQELYNRLKLCEEHITTLRDDILKHNKIEDSWIYKANKSHQIRIQYKYTNGCMEMINYRFIQSDRDDQNYVEEMQREYQNLNKSERTYIVLPKKIQ